MLKLGRILGRNYHPLNLIEISEDILIKNYNYLSSLDKQIEIAPVLKSNAYGHGLPIIAKLVDKLNPPFVCVDSLFEAYELTKHKVKSPILIMGYVYPKSLQTKKLPYAFTIFNKETLDILQRFQPHAPIHLFVDTGMHREGISIDELADFVKHVKKHTTLRIEGLMSHFAMSDKPSDKLTKQQIEVFSKAQIITKELEINPKWVHIANSSGILNYKSYKGKLGNLARVGKAFYGYDPEGNDRYLKPALDLKTYVAQIKYLQRGEMVGYDFTYTAKKIMKIAILPIGYNDGVDRGLSNTGFVLVKGKLCPIIGRVSMNITTIDVSGIEKIKVGERVTVFSKNPEDKNSLISASSLAGKITHEILIHLSPSTKRVLV